MKILQDVVTKAEIKAKELAETFMVDQHKASKDLKKYAEDHKLTYGEVLAISNIATCMIHGKKWKK